MLPAPSACWPLRTHRKFFFARSLARSPRSPFCAVFVFVSRVNHFMVLNSGTAVFYLFFFCLYPQGFTLTRTRQKETTTALPVRRSPKIWSSTKTHASARWWNTYRRSTRWRDRAWRPPTNKAATAPYTYPTLAASKNARDLISRKHSKVQPLSLVCCATWSFGCFSFALFFGLLFHSVHRLDIYNLDMDKPKK